MRKQTKLTLHLLIWTWSAAVCLTTAGAAGSESVAAEGKPESVRFDTIIQLNAPSCRTHVVLFARCWVGGDSYRIAVVWAEPHTGSLNFPIYPPTLNIASDPNRFIIDHQLIHTYDGAHTKPLGQRGPFRHRFNSYLFSDARFAEPEALKLRVYAADLQPRQSTDEAAGLAQAEVRSSGDRMNALRLLDRNGDLLKAIDYEYADSGGGPCLQRQRVFLPQRSITVGFSGKGPTIRIGDEERQYSQLETTHHAGGRTCVVDYQQVDIGGKQLSLPVRIVVSSQDGKRKLRSARMYNVTPCVFDADQVTRAAEAYSRFDAEEVECRDLLLRYWLKDPADVNEVDVQILRRLHTHFVEKSETTMTVGQRLWRVNMLLELDWMLGDTTRLDEDFGRYLSLLVESGLDRMVLFGGQGVMDTTIRWGYIPIADKLLARWLDAALARNDAEVLFDFAAAQIKRGRLWTIAKLLERMQAARWLSASQQFAAQALRCMALARVCEMLQHPDYIKAELGIAQVRWVLAQTSADAVGAQLAREMAKADALFAQLDQPSREQRALRGRLTKLRSQTQTRKDPNEPAEEPS